MNLKAQGLTDREISTATGVPINTIRTWRNHGLPKYALAPAESAPRHPTCGDEIREIGGVPSSPYSYLHGIYLGDGCLARNGTSWTLRVTLDAAYPGIISECIGAVQLLDSFIGPKR